MADEPRPSMSRRVVVKAGLVSAGALLGCDRDADTAAKAAMGEPGSDAGGAAGATTPPGPAGEPGVAPPDAAPRADVADPGASTDAEASDAARADKLAAIDTIVVLCMENRSFDHYLGARSLLEGRPVDGLTAGMKNLGRDGTPVLVNRLERFSTADPPHNWDPVHRQWNEGAMDGFAREIGAADAAVAMGYYARNDVPVLWGLADHFVTCDRWFCSVLGPTWPNRMYLHGATSLGVRDNLPIAFGFTSIFALLAQAGRTHANYFVDVPWAAGGYFKTAGNLPIERFFADAAAGKLPNFAVIDPGFFGPAANDDHPAHDVRLGQAFISSIYQALAKSPQWKRCLFVITYDEHGGFFDHVPPPKAVDVRADFRQLGVRVPTVVAGGPVRRGAVVSDVFDHVSVIATLTRRFGLPALNARVTATRDLSVCIDPALIDSSALAPELPPAPPITMNRVVELDRATRGVRPRAHTELWDMAEAGRIPRALDRRHDALAITERWLSAGARLGAVDLR